MYKHPASAAVVGGVLVLQLAGASRVVLEQKKEIDRGGLQSISMYEMPSMPDGHHSTYGTTAIASWQLINHGAQVTIGLAEGLRHAIDQRRRRIVGHEALRELA